MTANKEIFDRNRFSVGILQSGKMDRRKGLLDSGKSIFKDCVKGKAPTKGINLMVTLNHTRK
jgi:hypothetical protein